MAPAKPEQLTFYVSKGDEYITFQELPERKNDPGSFFQVRTRDLKIVSEVARSAVASLSHLYVAPSRTDSKLQAAIEDIAEAGEQLRITIFRDSEAAKKYGERIACNRSRVTFFVSSSVPVHPPYGLMFGGPDAPAALTSSNNALKNKLLQEQFWRQKHSVSVVYVTTDQMPRTEDYEAPAQTRQQGTTQVFGIFNDRALKIALESKALKWPQVVSATSAKEFKRRWPEAASDNNILYFFCHADGETLQIANTGNKFDDVIIPINLWNTIEKCEEKRNNRQVGGLIVLNGCQTAAFSGEGMWLKATRASAFNGFIGTEAKVPIKFAWPFGNDLLNLIVSEGRSPLDAMKKLWKVHWPLSILYNLYCVADTRIRRPLALEYLDPVGHKNYSHHEFGRGPDATLPFGKEEDFNEQA